MTSNFASFRNVGKFRAQEERLVKGSFIVQAQPQAGRLIRLLSLITNIGLEKFLPTYCLIRLSLYNPKIVVSQLILRKGGLKGAYQWVRLWELKKILEEYKPESILELGSGGSTILFKLYSDRHKIRFVSVEEDAKWRKDVIETGLKIQQKLTSLATNVLLRERVQKVDSIKQELVCSFESSQFHRNYVDFVYVDGPTNWVHENEVSGHVQDPENTLPNIDAVLLEQLPKLIVIDGRRSSIRYLLESDKFDDYKIFLSRKYYEKSQWDNVPLYKHPYHTIIALER